MNGDNENRLFFDSYYKGFHIQIPYYSDNTSFKLIAEGVKDNIDALIDLKFEPSWNKETTKQALAIETPAVAPVAAPSVDLSTNATCPVHGTPLVWKAGTSKKTGKAYAFWSCPTKNADGSYCQAATQK